MKKVLSVIKQLMPNSNVRKVFKELGTDENDVPLHLNLISLNFATEEVIERIKNVALDLKKSPQVITELIRDANWRPTLVGNAFTILLREEKFQSDLIWRLENWSWVAPQIAVGIALIDKGSAEKELERILENASEDSNPKTIMSVYSSLKFLESNIAEKFEGNKLFNILKEKDYWDKSIDIAEKYWNFWKEIEPIK